jgi:hypothetical protein
MSIEDKYLNEEKIKDKIHTTFRREMKEIESLLKELPMDAELDNPKLENISKQCVKNFFVPIKNTLIWLKKDKDLK